MKRSVRTATCLLALTGGAVLLTPGAGAQDIASLESRIESAEAEAAGLATEIDAASAQIVDAQAEAQAAAAREAELTAVLDQGRARLAALEQRVAEAEAALERTRSRLQRALDTLAKRLVAIYKGGAPDAATLILEADGFEDLATRAEYLQAIEESDSKLVARVRALREQVARQLEQVEHARTEQEAFNAQVEAARAEIADARAAAEARAAELASARAEQAGALEALRSQVDGWTAQVQELRAAQAAEAEAEAIAAAEAQQEVASWVGDYAIPSAIVMCESGGNYSAVNPESGAGGAYQILPSTWSLYGGEGSPQEAPRAEQDQIAAEIWADSGASAWACAR
jgi:peptidoglycan hydrolase CwlO-like protein